MKFPENCEFGLECLGGRGIAEKAGKSPVQGRIDEGHMPATGRRFSQLKRLGINEFERLKQ